MQLAHKNQSSKQVLARHGKSFYWASLFLGHKLANRAARLYEFCRFVDDIADGDLPHRHETLADISASLKDNASSPSPEVAAFLNLASEVNIPMQAATELLDGMLLDQQPTAVKDQDELLRYCHAVAGTVGLMMCKILDCKHPRAEHFAIDLGVAMQLTNIARDVLEDAKMGRRYLPQQWVDFSAAEIATGQLKYRYPTSTAIEKLLNLADKYYYSALLGIQLLPFRSRFSITIALRVYRQIGVLLQRQKLAWWKGRVVVSKIEKLFLSLCSLVDLIPKKVPPHQPELHQSLKGLAGVEAN
jgi:phytoene synthase